MKRTSAKGVGWKTRRLSLSGLRNLRLVTDSPFTINDLGCGVGDFISLLDKHFEQYQYFGYDVLEEMVRLAEREIQYPSPGGVPTDRRRYRNGDGEDYTIASGIFNLRYSATDEEWLQEYVTETLHQMDQKSKKVLLSML